MATGTYDTGTQRQTPHVAKHRAPYRTEHTRTHTHLTRAEVYTARGTARGGLHVRIMWSVGIF